MIPECHALYFQAVRLPKINLIISSIIIIILLTTTSVSFYLLFLPLLAMWTHLEGQLLYDFTFQL